MPKGDTFAAEWLSFADPETGVEIKQLVHRGSFHAQILHVHPRFSPDGDQVLFASDAGGYGNLHLVDTPDFDSLPEERDA